MWLTNGFRRTKGEGLVSGMKLKKIGELDGLSAGSALRHQLFNKITPILLGSDQIDDSPTRLMIQASCLDMVTALEDLIETYGLDRHAVECD